MSKSYFGRISETIKGRDLIIWHRCSLGHRQYKCSVWTPGGSTCTGATTYMSKFYLGHISETIKAKDVLHGAREYSARVCISVTVNHSAEGVLLER